MMKLPDTCYEIGFFKGEQAYLDFLFAVVTFVIKLTNRTN